MRDFIEKLIGRLEEVKDTAYNTYKRFEMAVDLGRSFGAEKAIEIINQLAEEYDKREFYEITLNGCDDDTTFVMAMTELEYDFLIRVSQKANETSTYGCMPRLYVEKAEMIEPKGE